MIGIKQAVIIGLGASTIAGGGYGTYYLLSDKTIEDKLNREGFDFIKVYEGYQVAFKELKEKTTFIQDIKSYGTQITNASEFKDGGVALSKWCNAKIKESLSIKDLDSLINKVKEYCKDRPLTIGTKLGKKLLTSGWTERLNSLKPSGSGNDGGLLEDLKTVNGTLKDLNEATDNKVVKALTKWCKESYFKKLIEDKDDKIFEKVGKRCT